MPHNIRVAVIGEDEYVPRLSPRDSGPADHPRRQYVPVRAGQGGGQAAAGRGVQLCESSAAAVVNSEIVLVCASRREMGTELAPISQCTRGRTLVTICDSGAVWISRSSRSAWSLGRRSSPLPSTAARTAACMRPMRSTTECGCSCTSPAAIWWTRSAAEAGSKNSEPRICCFMTFREGETYEETAYSRFF